MITPRTVPGTNTLLLGPTGTGKTVSLRTLAAAGLDVFVLATEQQTIQSLLDGRSVDAPREKLHYSYIAPAAEGWAALTKMATAINKFSLDILAKQTDVAKKDYVQFLDVIGACANFTDENGTEFGPVDEMDESCAFVIDGMSGLSVMARDITIGAKPTASPGDWNTMMTLVEKFIYKCCQLPCHFVLVGHVEKEIDEVFGGSKLMVSTLGRKLAPKIPRFFDDVLIAKRDGNKFAWSTSEPQADLKPKNLPISSNLPQDFNQIIDIWRKRQ